MKVWEVLVCHLSVVAGQILANAFSIVIPTMVMGRICGCPGTVIDTVWSLPGFLVLCLPIFSLTTCPIFTVIFEQRGPRGETLNSVKSSFQLYLYRVALWHVWNSKWAWQRMKWVFQILLLTLGFKSQLRFGYLYISFHTYPKIELRRPKGLCSDVYGFKSPTESILPALWSGYCRVVMPPSVASGLGELGNRRPFLITRTCVFIPAETLHGSTGVFARGRILGL